VDNLVVMRARQVVHIASEESLLSERRNRRSDPRAANVRDGGKERSIGGEWDEDFGRDGHARGAHRLQATIHAPTREDSRAFSERVRIPDAIGDRSIENRTAVDDSLRGSFTGVIA
jgi:hypothetical protein